MIHVNFVNDKSSGLTDLQIKIIASVLQIQVSRDFKARWGYDCVTVIGNTDHSHWILHFVHNSDVAGALGYHEITSSGMPVGFVFTAGQDFGSIMVTASHELLEMLADPFANQCAQSQDGKIYALEVCDPVENDTYLIHGYAVSNFVTLAWFQNDPLPPYDFMGLLAKPFELNTGGYCLLIDSKTGKWYLCQEEMWTKT